MRAASGVEIHPPIAACPGEMTGNRPRERARERADERSIDRLTSFASSEKTQTRLISRVRHGKVKVPMSGHGIRYESNNPNYIYFSI